MKFANQFHTLERENRRSLPPSTQTRPLLISKNKKMTFLDNGWGHVYVLKAFMDHQKHIIHLLKYVGVVRISRGILLDMYFEFDEPCATYRRNSYRNLYGNSYEHSTGTSIPVLVP